LSAGRLPRGIAGPTVGVGRELRKRIFDVLEELAEGFFNNRENKLSEADLPTCQ
jgi:hypothetical protein